MNFGVPAEGGCRKSLQLQAMSVQLERRRLLAVTAILEAATGLALIATPAMVATLLLAAPLDKTGVTVARIGGAALIALGIACWPSRSSTRDGPYLGMLVYSVLATLVLAEVAISGQGGGKLLWPAIVLHAILSGLLAFARFGGARPDRAPAPL